MHTLNNPFVCFPERSSRKCLYRITCGQYKVYKIRYQMSVQYLSHIQIIDQRFKKDFSQKTTFPLLKLPMFHMISWEIVLHYLENFGLIYTLYWHWRKPSILIEDKMKLHVKDLEKINTSLNSRPLLIMDTHIFFYTVFSFKCFEKKVLHL